MPYLGPDRRGSAIDSLDGHHPYVGLFGHRPLLTPGSLRRRAIGTGIAHRVQRNVGPNPLYRSYGLLRTAVIGGTKVTVNGPTLVAAGLTELQVELITDNGGSVAVVNQFDTTGSFTGPPEEPISVRRVSFHRPSNGTTAYAHTAKVYAGGRDISEGEALATARAALPSQGLDEANLIMKVTTDVALAARVQRLDLETNALVDEPTLP